MTYSPRNEIDNFLTEKTNFKGEFGPLEDEIQIRKFLEKNKNTTTFKGAFSHVKLIYKISVDRMELFQEKILKDITIFFGDLLLLIFALFPLDMYIFIYFYHYQRKKWL
jgi:hypothetical protein